MPTHSLARKSEPLTSSVLVDDVLRDVLKPFDLDADTPTSFYPWELPGDAPADFSIGVIVGASGSGKTTLMQEFGTPETPSWNPQLAIASHFGSAEAAADRLYAVGLNSVPVWRQPYQTLSNGQRFRADLARTIGHGAVVDEFTSVVDRNVAKSASRALRAWVDRERVRRLVLVTVHRDILPWVRPDWVIDTDAGVFTDETEYATPRWWAEFTHKNEGEVGRIVLG